MCVDPTNCNGTCFECITEKLEREDQRRANAMPDTEAALRVMCDSYRRLESLGWKPAIYCPKDGTPFLAIEAGCGKPGICQYHGEWPKGSWFMAEAGDLWPSHPILFKPMEQNNG